MSLGYWRADQIYLYRHPVDMRKGSNSLAILVNEEISLDPVQNLMFVFINKQRNKIKLLIWKSNGFWLLSKNLLKQRFKWPKWFETDSLTLSENQLIQLLDGIDLNGMRPHDDLSLAFVA